MYIPASLIGGMIGLCLLQLSTVDAKLKEFVHRGEEAVIVDPPLSLSTRFALLTANRNLACVAELAGAWEELPSLLINIVFGCLFLGERVPPLSKVWRISGPQLMYGQIVAWGQYAIPALVTAALLVPALDSNKVSVSVCLCVCVCVCACVCVCVSVWKQSGAGMQPGWCVEEKQRDWERLKGEKHNHSGTVVLATSENSERKKNKCAEAQVTSSCTKNRHDQEHLFPEQRSQSRS